MAAMAFLRIGTREGWWRVGLFAGYSLLVLATTWPLARTPATRLVVGTEPVRTVSLFNAWTVWWNADRAAHCFTGYWNAPIFFPTENAFAFSEPQPMTVVVAPIIWLTESRLLAMNVYLAATLILNGLLANRLLRTLGLRRVIACGGGAAMILLPIVHWQLGVMQLAALWPSLWTFDALWRIVGPPTIGPQTVGPQTVGPQTVGPQTVGPQTVDQPTVKSAAIGQPSVEPAARGTAGESGWVNSVGRGLMLGVALATSWWTCSHHALFLMLLLLVATPICVLAFRRRAVWIGLSVAGIVSSLLVFPLVIHLHQVTIDYEFVRSDDLVQRLSNFPSDYWLSFGHSLANGIVPVARPEWTMSPGLLKIVWATVAVGLCWRRRYRLATLFFAVLGVAAFLLSLGPHLQLAGWSPWRMVVDFVPGFAQVRNVFRFGFFFQLCVVLLTAIAVDHVWSLLDYPPKTPSNSSTTGKGTRRPGKLPRAASLVARAAVVVLGLAAIFDPWPIEPRLASASDLPSDQPWIDRLAREFAGDSSVAVFCLPMAGENTVEAFEVTAQWMYLGTWHGVPLANGYSGFFPPDYFRLRSQMQTEGLTAAAVGSLHTSGIRFLAIDRRRVGLDWGADYQLPPWKLSRLSGDGRGIDLYRITDSSVAPAEGASGNRE
jgi:hypothetical protein